MKSIQQITLLVLTLTLCTFVTTAHAAKNPNQLASARITTLHPTKIVTITPPRGYAPRPVRVRLSKSEQEMIELLDDLAENWNSDFPPPQRILQWRLEPSVENSPTLALSINILNTTRAFLSVPASIGTFPIVVIVARTQKFIKEQVAALGCRPSLEINGGQYLMGATLCDRRVIVINLTGYFFLKSATQFITPEMEQRPEPLLRRTPYAEVDRNLSGLAHEWTHVARNRLTNGFVPNNEPAWFREGLAEIISGLSRVRSSNGLLSYLEFHVIRIRRFSNWSENCTGRLRTYRRTSSSVSGCEYLRGAAALEMLLARHGGIPKIIELFRNITSTNDFFASFRQTYGFTVSSFEKRADIYARHIRAAARIGP
jgi:hypothetical protein